MVTKSKLKMALAADKGTDFKKMALKKKEKLARKKNVDKAQRSEEGGDWEDVDDVDDEEVNDLAKILDGEISVGELEDEESGSEEEDDEEGGVNMKINFDEIDESDSDSSAGENDQENSDASEDEDEEDIPISDLEDLSDEEKEDMIPHQRLTINNTIALTAALKRISLPIQKLPFSEHQSITTSLPVDIVDVSDDLNRELAFYAQSLSAVHEARKKFKEEGVPFTRPTDYFAEMVKADEHMAKIKAKLIDEAAGKKASAEARKQRDLKKFGKQVQVAKIQEREKERKQTMEKIKTLKRKRQGADNETTNEADLFDVAVEDELKPNSRKDRMGPNKRAKKDEKYGHGGKKRFKKSGDAMSSGDLSGTSFKRMKSGGASKGGAAKRPGKARRAGKR